MPYQLRSATLDDVPILCLHRRQMFEDMGHRDSQLLGPMAERFAEWVTERIKNQTYLAWIAVTEDQQIAASAGLWLVDWPPHVMGPEGHVDISSMSIPTSSIAERGWRAS